jgi:hypothetical protein
LPGRGVANVGSFGYLSGNPTSKRSEAATAHTGERYAPFNKKHAVMDKGDIKLLNDIKQYGWHVIKVMEDDKGPGFAYSIGLFKTYNHPEILIVGLNLDLAHTLINNIGEDIKNGKIFRADEFYNDILERYKCLMISVSQENYPDYVGYGHWYYKNYDFPLLQCIYPTIKGIYPWENDWPENIKDLQPILGIINDKINGA